MTRKPAVLLFAVSMLGASGPKQPFEVSTTEQVPFLPGGTIRLVNSYGHLTVEGWDEPKVEITVTKATARFFESDEKEKAEKNFDQIRVITDRRSDKELAISTTIPVRNSLFASVLPNNKRGVTLEYTIHVPRDSRLVVRHDNGYVWVSDVTGDIEVNSHTGDMIVMLPDPGQYLIDAKTRLGSVTSDFAGRALSQFLLGTHFAYPNEGPSRRIDLRMGRGSITIKKGPPSGPFGTN
jgi:hypothetical protein